MGTCKHCGNKAGMFSSSHSECQNKYEAGVKVFISVLHSYFYGTGTINDVIANKSRLKNTAYLKDEDVCSLSRNVIADYVSQMKMPFPSNVVDKMDVFLNAIGIPFSQFNATGIIDEFSRKMIGFYMVDYFLDKVSLVHAIDKSQNFLQLFPLSSHEIKKAYLLVLDKAVRNFMKNGSLSSAEQQKIDNYIAILSLPINNLPAEFQNSDISRISQMTIIANIQKGIMPSNQVQVPVILAKNESVLWTYNGVAMFEEKITKEWEGRTGGVNVRIIKGVSYRIGRMRGRPVEHSSMVQLGTGTLYVTNKNLIFNSPLKGLKIPYSKIVGITPYSDGLEIQRDGTNVKRLTAQGFEPWFIMNLLSHISNL